MITLTDIAYVRSGVADLGAAVRFATGIVGLELAAPSEAGVAHLRADHRHHCLALVEGPSGVISSGFTVADSDALAAAETQLQRRVPGMPRRSGRCPVPAGPRVHRVRRPVRQPPGTGQPAGDDHAAGRLLPAGRDHRVRPSVPGRAGRSRGPTWFWSTPVQRTRLGLDRRRPPASSGSTPCTTSWPCSEVIGLFAHDRGRLPDPDELIELRYQASLSPAGA